MNYKDRLSANPNIMLGKTVIKGTRITVEIVLQKLADGYTTQEVLEMYPGLVTEDIEACMRYVAAIVASEEIIKAA